MKANDLEKYKGIIVAMNSCYDASGKVNIDAVKKLTKFLAQKGVKGVYIGGSTGEGFLQSIEERKKVLEAVMETAGKELTVIAQVGAISTRDSIELAKHAESVKVDAISAVPPFYYKVSENGVEKHWEEMMKSTTLPFIIYHIPSTTGFHMSTDLLRKMIRHEQVIGIKITSPNAFELQQFKSIGGDNFVVFNGPDEQYLSGRVMGADAGIGGTYGIMPELFLQIEKHYLEGNIEEAKKWQFRVNDIIADILQVPIYGALKAVLKQRGMDCGVPRMPIEPLSAQDQDKVATIYEKLNNYLIKL
jgi:N-acetylneuraminate lyase